MKNAKKQAESIPQDKRAAKTIETLREAAKLKKQAAKDLEVELEKSEAALKQFVATVPREHRREAILTQNKVNKLLAELRGGANVEDIVKKMNELRH